ncbi:MAG TPA: ABC transporter permease [Jatrophihabitans sp.]|jgi:simple sugar transport system permease protein
MTDLQEAPAVVPASATKRFTLGTRGWILISLASFLFISLIRVTTDAENLTSVGAVQSALKAAVPIALAGLAGLWSERAGVVNIGLEGMMILGSFGCGEVGQYHGAWGGVITGMICGALGGLVLALATVTFGVDHIVAGVALTIVAQGLTLFLANLWMGGQKGKSVPDVQRITINGFAPWLHHVQEKGWFFVSDLAGTVGGFVTQFSVLSLLTIIFIIASGWILWRTRFGLRLRSTGEAPYAAESLGVSVYWYKYVAVTISGAIAGLGGAFLVVGLNYQDQQTGGRGYIGLASLIFGNWRPAGMALGSVLFGYTDGVRLYDPTGEAMHAFVLLVSIALAVYAALQFRLAHRAVALVSAVIAALGLLWFAMTDTIPEQFVGAAPYVITLLVMGLASQHLRPPKADGHPYRKGSH